MSITPVDPSLVDRLNPIHQQIGFDIRDLRMKLNLIINQSGINPEPKPDSYQPEAVLVGELTRVSTNGIGSTKRDIALVARPDGLVDMALDASGDLLADNTPQTAVLMSLFSDRRVNRERGWWADQVIDRITGSRLWTLKRAKSTTETLRLVEQYTAEALQWLLDSEAAEDVSVHAQWSTKARGYLELTIHITPISS